MAAVTICSGFVCNDFATEAATGQEEIPHVQGQKRSPSTTVGGANSCLDSSPIPTRDTQRAQSNLVCTRTQGPHRNWDGTVFERLLWRYGSAVACRRDRGSGCSWCGYGVSPLGEGSHYPHHRAARTYTGLGNRLLEGTNRTLCTRTQEKGTVTPQETDPDLPGVSRSLQRRHGSAVACCRVGGTERSSACVGSFEGGRHSLHYLHHRLKWEWKWSHSVMSDSLWPHGL